MREGGRMKNVGFIDVLRQLALVQQLLYGVHPIKKKRRWKRTIRTGRREDGMTKRAYKDVVSRRCEATRSNPRWHCFYDYRKKGTVTYFFYEKIGDCPLNRR
jgi:hypothetical protein